MKPVLQALLLADHVYVGASHGYKIVAGIFSSLVIVKKRPEQERQTSREQQTGPTSDAADTRFSG